MSPAQIRSPSFKGLTGALVVAILLASVDAAPTFRSRAEMSNNDIYKVGIPAGDNAWYDAQVAAELASSSSAAATSTSASSMASATATLPNLAATAAVSPIAAFTGPLGGVQSNNDDAFAGLEALASSLKLPPRAEMSNDDIYKVGIPAGDSAWYDAQVAAEQATSSSSASLPTGTTLVNLAVASTSSVEASAASPTTSVIGGLGDEFAQAAGVPYQQALAAAATPAAVATPSIGGLGDEFAQAAGVGYQQQLFNSAAKRQAASSSSVDSPPLLPETASAMTVQITSAPAPTTTASANSTVTPASLAASSSPTPTLAPSNSTSSVSTQTPLTDAASSSPSPSPTASASASADAAGYVSMTIMVPQGMASAMMKAQTAVPGSPNNAIAASSSSPTAFSMVPASPTAQTSATPTSTAAANNGTANFPVAPNVNGASASTSATTGNNAATDSSSSDQCGGDSSTNGSRSNNTQDESDSDSFLNSIQRDTSSLWRSLSSIVGLRRSLDDVLFDRED